MRLLGYSDRLSVAPGDTIRFMVSCEHPSYRADLVRLIHGDESPRGPGYKERLVASDINGEYPGRAQHIHSGSYVIVEDSAPLRQIESFTLAVWLYPTTPQAGSQGLLTRWSAADRAGYGLCIDEAGDLALWLGDGTGTVERLSTGTPLRAHDWYFVAATYDATSGRVCLYQVPVRRWPVETTRAVVERTAAVRPRSAAGSPFLMAGYLTADPATRGVVDGHFNGKLDRPRLFGRALRPAEVTALRDGASPHDYSAALVAAWDFSADIPTDKVTDTSNHQLHGRAINMPTRAVTGYNWTGTETSFRLAPHEYGAIYFHDDDLEDAGWQSDFALTVPADLPSGVYASRLRANDDEDYLPFFVRPLPGTSTAPIAVLVPTIHYLAYANFRDISGGIWDLENLPNADVSLHRAEYTYAAQHGLPGLYDLHSDGSGTAYVSRLRPILNMRPKFRYRVWGAPARFPADLYLTDWLETKGYAADIITDDDLHAEGADLLAPYKVVLTGSHHEYWTSRMLAALDTYLQDGGRLMYLGGNGLFGVTSVDPQRPHVIEVRRWGTSWPFEMPPGERYHSTTGEPGGIWRNRGWAPNRFVGVGSSAAGFDCGAPYVRQPGSFDPRAAFIFEGIGPNEAIGDFPSLMVQHGAAGYEMDRLDFSLGTPPHALLLASSVGHSDRYNAFIDERLQFTKGIDGVLSTTPPEEGVLHPFIRADMVYFETPRGGAVFSVGSIAWRGSLSYNGYDNNVSRITENVLRRFAEVEPNGLAEDGSGD